MASTDKDFEMAEYIDWDEGRDFPEDNEDEDERDDDQDAESD